MTFAAFGSSTEDDEFIFGERERASTSSPLDYCRGPGVLVTHPSVNTVCTAAAALHRSRPVTWTLNSCCIYHLFSETNQELYSYDAENTRLHQSGSYLATDEDERPCDDRPVFDKCVFHLVGERSTEGKKSARGNRGGEERASEGRCEANAVNDSTREAGKDTGGRERESLPD